MKNQPSLKDRVQHLEKMRQDFVANVSHELRTPLTVIHGYLESLLKKFQGQHDERKIFEAMLHQSMRMERLVEDLLLLSRLESDIPDKHNFKPVYVAKIVEKIIADAKVLGANKNHLFSIEIAEDFVIHGIENELDSAFSNLIFNAVNYTPANGKISVRGYQNKNNLFFSVSDTGIGIETQHIERVTERFYRVDHDRSRKSGGTGLGLAIVKHVLLRHDAKLQIRSQFGIGSDFACIFEMKRDIVNK